MISCIVFNCAGVNSYDPIRFAGTWKQYSKKAMPQLTTITFHSASLRNRKCPYHATVMKIFEIVSSRMRSEEHTSELQSQSNLVCRLLLEKKKKTRCTASPLKRGARTRLDRLSVRLILCPVHQTAVQ